MVAAALEQRLGLNSRNQQAQPQRSFDSGHSVSGGGSSSSGSSRDSRLDSLSHCRLLNISVCEHTVSASRNGSGFGIVLYNPLAWRRSHFVRVPIAGNDSWTVSGANMLTWHTAAAGASKGSQPVLLTCWCHEMPCWLQCAAVCNKKQLRQS